MWLETVIAQGLEGRTEAVPMVYLTTEAMARYAQDSSFESNNYNGRGIGMRLHPY